MLAIYSDDPSSNPAEVYNFSEKLFFKITKINKKRPRLAHLKKKIVTIITAQCVVSKALWHTINFVLSKALWQTINFVLSKALWPVINIPDWINGYFGHNKQARLN